MYVAVEDVTVDTPRDVHVAEAMLHKRDDMDTNLDTHMHPPPTTDAEIGKRCTSMSPKCIQIGIFAGRVDTTWMIGTPAGHAHMRTDTPLIRKEPPARMWSVHTLPISMTNTATKESTKPNCQAMRGSDGQGRQTYVALIA